MTKKFILKKRCYSCKRLAELEDYNGILLCKECSKKFDEELIKKYEDDEYGRDLLIDEKLKRGN